jgi:undecaprenyl-diphosphatase
VPLVNVAALAALHGLTEALPVSRSGHEVVARLWLDEGIQARAMETYLHLGTALALVAVARRRLFGALGDGVRAVSRPAIFRGSPSAQDALVIAVGTVVSLVTSALVTPRVEMWSESPTATGVGLCVTGLGLASTALIPRTAGALRLRGVLPFGGGQRAARPSLPGSVIAGMAVGLAAFPGASRVGAAITLLLWMGVRPGRALDLSFLLAAPALLVAFLAGATHGATGLTTGTIALGMVLAFVGAAVASELLRSLAERRRLGVLALWTLPLGLALLAYARALPLPS